MKEITTGRNSDKFGLTGKEVISLIGKYKNSKYLSLKCLSVHIGSQITSNTPYSRMLRVVQRIIDKSRFQFNYVDLGGGMGIDYGIEKN